MKTFIKIVQNEKETKALARRCAAVLKPGAIVCLMGDLGAGKTAFVKGAAQALKIKGDQVCSPTYVLMNVYEDGRLPLYHFDLYRLGETQEIGALGYEEFLYGEGVSIIEWADRFGGLMPEECLIINIEHKKETKRKITLKACGESYEKILQKISEKNK